MRLSFKFLNRSYDIKWNKFNVIQIMGDSSVGKSLLVNDILYMKKSGDNLFDNVWVVSHDLKSILFNFEDYFKSLISLPSNSIIVVDNADVILDSSMVSMINKRADLYWIIMGRKFYGCVPCETCVGYLVKDKNNTFTVDYSK